MAFRRNSLAQSLVSPAILPKYLGHPRHQRRARAPLTLWMAVSGMTLLCSSGSLDADLPYYQPFAAIASWAVSTYLLQDEKLPLRKWRLARAEPPRRQSRQTLPVRPVVHRMCQARQGEGRDAWDPKPRRSTSSCGPGRQAGRHTPAALWGCCAVSFWKNGRTLNG